MNYVVRSALVRSLLLTSAVLTSAATMPTVVAAEPAKPYTLELKSAPTPAETGYFKMGTSRRPDGRELTVDSQSLRLDGQPWLPVMGEFHYSRYPAAEWR